jgi:hypothetical protein
MNSKKRRTLRKERNSVIAQGIEFKRLTGDAITPVIWQRFQAFYQLTNLKYNRHHGYLTPEFFERIYLTMRDSLLLVVAFEGDEAIAGALNFIGVIRCMVVIGVVSVRWSFCILRRVIIKALSIASNMVFSVLILAHKANIKSRVALDLP